MQEGLGVVRVKVQTTMFYPLTHTTPNLPYLRGGTKCVSPI